MSAVLINPEFLFRVEVDPDRRRRAPPIRISDLELASRLSFFSGAACPMTRCSIRPFAESSAGQACSSATSAECSRIRAHTISPATLPDSGSGCAT